MNIVPTRIQEQINGVDRTRSLVYGILGAVTVLVSIYQLFWLFYAATMFSAFGITAVFSFVWWIAMGLLGAFVAIAYLGRYFKQP
jgi:ABC-type uncharacterized transport system fused permease/ATPase subunit